MVVLGCGGPRGGAGRSPFSRAEHARTYMHTYTRARARAPTQGRRHSLARLSRAPTLPSCVISTQGTAPSPTCWGRGPGSPQHLQKGPVQPPSRSGVGDRVLGYLCRKHRRNPTPCSRNPRPRGLQRLRHLQTPAASGRGQCLPGSWLPSCWAQASWSSAAVSVSTGSAVGDGWAKRVRPKPKSIFRK